MPEGWSYLDELEAHQEIVKTVQAQKLQNYAIAATLYETTASVQYYLLITQGVVGWTKDYYHNQYLFVLSKKSDLRLETEKAYELAGFQKSQLLEKHEIGKHGWLFLYQR